MALATQCPHCHTTFRVAADQLKLRGGIVRCGACQSIFDGKAHLIDLDKLAADKAASAAAAAPPPAAVVSADAPAPPQAPPQTPPQAPPQAPEADAQPVYTLDFEHTLDPLGILPKATTAAPDVPAAAPVEPPARAHVWRTGAALRPAPDEETPAPEPAHGAAGVEPAPADPAPVESTAAESTAAESAPVESTAAESAPVDSTPEEAAADDVAPVGPVPDDVVPVDPAPVDPAPAESVPATAAVAVAASAYAPPGRIEPSFDLPPDEDIVARPLPDADPAFAAEFAPAPTPSAPLAPLIVTGPDTPPAALPLRASAGIDVLPSAPAPLPVPKSARGKAVEARTRRSKLTPTKIEAPKLRVAADADADEPEFVKRSRRQERTTRMRRILMGGGAAVLLLVLAAQAVVEFRNVLAARYPAAKPALGAACALLGCRVALPAQVENLAIETGELTTLGPDTYALNTLLRNQGGLAQAWPSIELELIDADDKPVLRRVFGPADYLPASAPAAGGFGARSEQPVRLHFALADLKPSGYHIFVFYP